MIGNVSKTKIGNIGEFFVAYDLSRLGIDVVVIGNNNRFGMPDLIISKNKTIEVKTSVWCVARTSNGCGHISKSGFGFSGLKKDRNVDYFAFVLLETDLSVYKVIYVDSFDINSGSFWYLRPNKSTRNGQRGHCPSETSWKSYFMTSEDLFNKLQNEI